MDNLIDGLNNLSLRSRIIIAILAISFLIFTQVQSQHRTQAEQPVETEQVVEVESAPVPEQVVEVESMSEGETVAEVVKQVVDSDVGLLEYRSATETDGVATITFVLTNKTGVTVVAKAEQVVASRMFAVETLESVTDGGGIASGESGIIQLMFDVSAETGLISVSDLKSLSGNLRVYDVETSREMGTIAFDVALWG